MSNVPAAVFNAVLVCSFHCTRIQNVLQQLMPTVTSGTLEHGKIEFPSFPLTHIIDIKLSFFATIQFLHKVLNRFSNLIINLIKLFRLPK